MEEKLRDLTVGKSLLIGLGLAAFYWFALYDDGVAKENLITSLDSEIVVKEKEITSINQALEDAARFQEKMNSLGAEMEKVQLAMPEKLTGLELMKIISNEAKGVGAEINQINAPDGNRQGIPNSEQVFYENIPIEIDITGTYNQVMLFMSNLTRLNKIITTHRMSLQLVAGSAVSALTSPRVNMKASLLAYRYLPKAQEAK